MLWGRINRKLGPGAFVDSNESIKKKLFILRTTMLGRTVKSIVKVAVDIDAGLVLVAVSAGESAGTPCGILSLILLQNQICGGQFGLSRSRGQGRSQGGTFFAPLQTGT